MIFFYHPSAGQQEIDITDQFFNSLIRGRRKKKGNVVQVHNVEISTDIIKKQKYYYKYDYEIVSISRRNARLLLVSCEKQLYTPVKNIHLGWGVCDNKTVYATLPMLNQLGVEKISFVLCERSQQNIVLSPEKIRNILIASCEQSGRLFLPSIEHISFKGFLQKYPETCIADFNGQYFQQTENISSLLVGPEGGFSEDERSVFIPQNIRTFNTPLVLKSETACIAVCSRKIL